jgi:hypothetical protein
MRGIEKLEAILGLLATFILGFGTPLVCLLGIIIGLNVQLPPWLEWVVFLVPVASGLLAIPMAWLANSALYDCFPEWTARGCAVRQKNKPELCPFAPSDEHADGRLPLAVAMALRLPRIPIGLRPLLSVWWLLHFGAGAMLGLGVYLATKQLLAAQAGALLVIPFLLDFGVLFAANLYLLMAVAVLGRNPTLWMKFWRWRILVDLALTVGMRLLVKA